jgi:hypothetical protein
MRKILGTFALYSRAYRFARYPSPQITGPPPVVALVHPVVKSRRDARMTEMRELPSFSVQPVVMRRIGHRYQ